MSNGIIAVSPAMTTTEKDYVIPTGITGCARDSKGKYVPAQALELIPEVTPILHLFLSGKMAEADAAVKAGDPKTETLYYALGESYLSDGEHPKSNLSVCHGFAYILISLLNHYLRPNPY